MFGAIGYRGPILSNTLAIDIRDSPQPPSTLDRALSGIKGYITVKQSFTYAK